MMGLTPREARRRFDEVIEFAELEEFAELKLKNYSSGMLVRLGFSLMTQVDADVLLIDEVLAVGDAAFQQKCFDAFAGLHAEGRTIVLVTHDMSAVERHCDRAILLEGGAIVEAGDPRDVARRYLRAQLRAPPQRRPTSEDVQLRRRRRDRPLSSTRASSAPTERRSPASSRASRSGSRSTSRRMSRIERPIFGFQIVNADGLLIFAPAADRARRGCQGARARRAGRGSETEIANPLAAGHYYVHCAVGRLAPKAELIAFRKNAADFVVFGAPPFGGLVEPRARAATARREPSEVNAPFETRSSTRASCARSAARRRSAAVGGGSSTCSGSPR